MEFKNPIKNYDQTIILGLKPDKQIFRIIALQFPWTIKNKNYKMHSKKLKWWKG